MSADYFDAIEQFGARLWKRADDLRANSNLASNEYFMPLLGLMFLRQATNRYYEALAAIEADIKGGKMPNRRLVEADFTRRRALMLPDEARFDNPPELGYRKPAAKKEFKPGLGGPNGRPASRAAGHLRALPSKRRVADLRSDGPAAAQGWPGPCGGDQVDSENPSPAIPGWAFAAAAEGCRAPHNPGHRMRRWWRRRGSVPSAASVACREGA